MPAPDIDPLPDDLDAAQGETSQPPPGTAPSASAYRSELPYAGELQSLLEGRYLVESFLGQGGMGAVYKGLQLPLKRPVAIKILARRQEGAEDDLAFEERFKREAYAMASLAHPNIVQVYDCGDAGEHFLFISMELVQGGDLGGMIKVGGVTPEVALNLIGPICDGLHAAHERGIVHRDVKPANIFLTLDGKPKVADFGLAKRLEAGATALTISGLGMGTPDYAAPEQFDGASDVDHRADVYSLGVMFYQMLTGTLPRGAYTPPSQMVAVDPRLDAVVARAMAQKRSERYQSVAELRAEVQAIVDTWMSPSAPAPPVSQATPAVAPPATRARVASGSAQPQRPSTSARPPAAPRKSRAGLLLGVLGVVAVAAAGAVLLRKKPPAPPAAAPRTAEAPSVATEAAPSEAATAVATMVSPLTSATKDEPYVNTLGMKFVPLSVIGSPEEGKALLMSVWETRVQDYEPFLRESGRGWPRPEVAQGSTHAVAGVSWEEAQAFCVWLTQRERAEGRLEAEERYRLPTDHEWSNAVGIGDQEDAAKPPAEKNLKLAGVYPWGSEWPPPAGAGNYWSEELTPLLTSGKYSFLKSVMPGNKDGQATVGPVGGYGLNESGIADLGGNVWEWCEDWYDGSRRERVLRGGCWADGVRALLLSSARIQRHADSRGPGFGFRCVLGRGAATLAVQTATAPVTAPPAPAPPPGADPAGVLTFGGHRYQLVITSGRQWAQAKAQAEAMGGHLATINSREEAEWFIKTYVAHLNAGATGPDPTYRVFLGGFRKASGGPWQWITGEPFSMDLWVGTRVAAESARDECLVWSILEDNDWASEKMDMGIRGFIVEWEDAAPPPTTVDKQLADGAPLQPSSPPADNPRLVQLDASFKERYAATAQAPYDKELRSLNESYVANGVARARAAAQSKGALEEVLVLDAEKARVERGEGIPETDDAALPAELKKLRDTYRAARSRLEADRAKKAAPLYDAYLSALNTDIAQLTKDNKIDDAKVARVWREGIAKRREREISPTLQALVGGAAARASAEAPFVNGLGMKFVPVPGTRVLFCMHETRYRDYAAYAAQTSGVDTAWKVQNQDGSAPAGHSQDHPVTNITWNEANAFCDWLGRREKATYRLPTDREWSVAVGIGPQEATLGFTSTVNTNTPIPDVFPWGQHWPPPPASGNFSASPDDGFATTSPVMSFKPNVLGIYDLGGNVWELCQDWLTPARERHVLRGGSYRVGDRVYLSSAQRSAHPAGAREPDCGFRVVLELPAQTR